MIDLDSEIYNCELIKTMVLTRLYKDNLLSKEQFAEYNNNWVVVLLKKKWYQNFFSSKKGGWFYSFVKLE